MTFALILLGWLFTACYKLDQISLRREWNISRPQGLRPDIESQSRFLTTFSTKVQKKIGKCQVKVKIPFRSFQLQTT